MTEKAIVGSGGRKLIGEIKKGDWVFDQVVVLKKAYELRTDVLVVPSPAGIAVTQQTAVLMIDGEEDAVDIKCRVDNIRWFSDMKDKGLKYQNMIDQCEHIVMQNRAHRAGLQTAGQIPEKKSNLIL